MTRSAATFEWLLGQGAAEVEWLYVREVHEVSAKRGTSRSMGYDVVAVVRGGSRKAIRAHSAEEANAILRELAAAAPRARIDTDGSLIAAGHGDRGIGFAEEARG